MSEVDKKVKLKSYLNTKVHPFMKKMIVGLLDARPNDVRGFMANWMKNEGLEINKFLNSQKQIIFSLKNIEIEKDKENQVQSQEKQLKKELINQNDGKPVLKDADRINRNDSSLKSSKNLKTMESTSTLNESKFYKKMKSECWREVEEDFKNQILKQTHQNTPIISIIHFAKTIKIDQTITSANDLKDQPKIQKTDEKISELPSSQKSGKNSLKRSREEIIELIRKSQDRKKKQKRNRNRNRKKRKRKK